MRTAQEKGLKETDIAWAAGLFEGEGWISINPKKRSLGLLSTDKDIVDKFYRLVDCGNIYIRYPKNPKHKVSWEWKTSKIYECKRILNLFIIYFGERRKEAANILLNTELTYGTKDICKYGHQKIKIWPSDNGVKRCVECPRRYKREAYDRKKKLNQSTAGQAIRR